MLNTILCAIDAFFRLQSTFEDLQTSLINSQLILKCAFHFDPCYKLQKFLGISLNSRLFCKTPKHLAYKNIGFVHENSASFFF